jgi:site-specific DNA-methyltransferase (adenine-specific)
MKNSIVKNIDCMVGMAEYPDKYFDLAVVDPPYGLGDRLIKGGAKGGMGTLRKLADNKVIIWDEKIPSLEYFNELKRISKYQIIWGGNYFLDYLNKTDGFIVWDKMNGTNPMADAELAWQNIKSTTRIFRWHHFSGERTVKIHPTQKPIALYDWIYSKYLPNGGKVIDTHLGSGSNRIAADKSGNIDFVGYELDKDYFEAQEKRWAEYKMQQRLF